MEPILLKNLCDLSKYFLSQFLELVLRTIRFIIPLGVYNYLLQMDKKPLSTTALGVYLTPKSTYMFVAPGVVLIAIDGDQYKNFFDIKRVQWNKNFPKYFMIIQCIAYICITVYFLSMLIMRIT